MLGCALTSTAHRKYQSNHSCGLWVSVRFPYCHMVLRSADDGIIIVNQHALILDQDIHQFKYSTSERQTIADDEKKNIP